MLICIIWLFVESAFVSFFYVETKGPTLKEIAKIFDGGENVAHVVEGDRAR